MLFTIPHNPFFNTFYNVSVADRSTKWIPVYDYKNIEPSSASLDILNTYRSVYFG